ncbi:MAG: helix-turn-helix domain-containing protein, partial [Paracoccaceae bacterium]
SLDERPEHLRGLEAAVLGARLSAGQGMAFLPLTLTGFAALTVSGAPEARLAGWITGAHRAVLAALMMLERLAAWRVRAAAATADLQGRTPAQLIAALAAYPMLGAAQAEAETGASRAAVQRNLDVLTARGLAREVTGQERFRVWAARV